VCILPAIMSMQLLAIVTCQARREELTSVARLVELGKRPTVNLYDSRTAVLAAEEVPAAIEWLKGHPDVTSVHVLMALRKCHPKRYEAIPAETKVRVLVSYLRHTDCADDWSYVTHKPIRLTLRGARVVGPVDYPAAQALLAIPARVAVPHLSRLLHDQTEVGYSGSARATESHLSQLRRCDLAYRYVCLLRGATHSYSRDPKERDKAIAVLIKELGAQPQK